MLSLFKQGVKSTEQSFVLLFLRAAPLLAAKYALQLFEGIAAP